jgi:hypothetical protein
MPTDSTATKLKILVRLQQDEAGYPPFTVEGIWALRRPSGSLVLDNIPFFDKGIAPGYTVVIRRWGAKLG